MVAEVRYFWYVRPGQPLSRHKKCTTTLLRGRTYVCGAYIMLIQFYSLIQCNTYSYNATFFKVCIVQPQKVSFYPQTRRFRYNFRFKSCPLWSLQQVYTILQLNTMQHLLMQCNRLPFPEVFFNKTVILPLRAIEQ